MKKNTLNLYPLTNLNEIDFSYKTVTIPLTCLDGYEEDYYASLKKINQKIGKFTKGLATILTVNQEKCLAIPVENTLTTESIKTRSGIIKIEQPTNNDVRHLKFNGCTDEQYTLIEKFLESTIRRQLQNSNRLIEDYSKNFFFKKPIASPDNISVEMLAGFKFRLVADGKYKVHLCLDITYRYPDKSPLSKSVNINNAEVVKRRYTGKRRGTRALLMFGDRWFPIEILGFGKKISEQTFFDEKTQKDRIVMEYTLTETKGDNFNVERLLNSDDITVIFCYPGKRADKKMYCASSLVRILHNTSSKEVKNLHKKSILPTPKRFELINKNVADLFSNLSYNGVPLKIERQPISENLQKLKPKNLKFAKGVVLQTAVEYENNYGHKGFRIDTSLGHNRKKIIQRNGFFSNENFGPQYLFAPSENEDCDITNAVIEAFKEDFVKECKRLHPKFEGFKKVIYYDFDMALSATDQVESILKTAKNQGIGEGTALFILPPYIQSKDYMLTNLHDCLKNKFFDENLFFQCISYKKIDEHYGMMPDDEDGYVYRHPNDEKAAKFNSIKFNLALEYLKLNEQHPYVLAENPNYDVYIGVDVHDRYAGIIFFYKNGEKIFRDKFKVPLKDKNSRYEKLPYDKLYSIIFDNLKEQLKRYCPKPNGIVLVRDGRSHDGVEFRVLKDIINSLHDIQLVNKEVIKWAVIDLHKNSATPLRVSSSLPERPFELPQIGTVKFLGRENENAFIYCTGFPFNGLAGRASAKPIHLSYAHGNADYFKIVEDLFAQTLLAYSAPERASSLPIIIKLLDSFLGSWAYGEDRWTKDEEDIPLDLQTDEENEEIVIEEF